MLISWDILYHTAGQSECIGGYGCLLSTIFKNKHFHKYILRNNNIPCNENGSDDDDDKDDVDDDNDGDDDDDNYDDNDDDDCDDNTREITIMFTFHLT